LSAQQVDPEVRWEIVVIDNASSDQTAQVAQALWPRDAPTPLRVIHEPQLGLSYARHRAFVVAEHEIVSFVDDDNWVYPDWIQTVSATMTPRGSVGACGGFAEPVYETSLPWWFDRCKHSYALGAQGHSSGDVTWTRGYLWGAGLSVRKSAWQALVDNGFGNLLADRTGAGLSSGGDVELCYAMRLAGWRLWYEAQLRLQHIVPAHRLDWQYYRRLCRSNGAASASYDPYRFASVKDIKRLRGRSGTIWVPQARACLGNLLRYRHRLLRLCPRCAEGDTHVPTMEELVGRLIALLGKRKTYDRDIYRVRDAAWRRPIPSAEAEL
jgi:glycosyltransferase involved in cell wall biosynthesis